MRTKNKYTKEQMFSLIRKWENGNQTQEEFFKKHNIAKSTFGYWRKKYLKEIGTVEKEKGFIPINVSMQENKISENPEMMELCYPNGVRLVFSSGIELGRLKPLITL